jgi:hypothetical protein
MLKTLACMALIACGSGTSVKPKVPDAPKQVDVLAYLPADTSAVIGLDVARLRKTALWAKYKPRLEKAFGPQLADIKAKCGFDPFDVITTITAGAKTDLGEDAVIVVRGLDKDKTTACVMKQAVPLSTAMADGEYITLHHQSGKVNMFTFVDASTVVIRGSNSPTKDGVKAAATAGSPLRSSTEFMADFSKVSTESTVWLVLTNKGKWMDNLAALGDRPLGIDLGVRISDAVKIDSRIRMGKPDAAQKMADAWKQQLAGAAMFIAGDVKVEATDVVISANIKSEMIDLVLASMGAGGGEEGVEGGVEGGKDDPPPPDPCGD